MPGTLSPPRRVSDPDMHHGTCMTHVPWWMLGSLTSGFLWSRCGRNVRGIPVAACAIRNITYLVRGPLLIECFVPTHYYNNDDLLSVELLGTHGNRSSISIFFTKTHLKLPFVKCITVCLLNMNILHKCFGCKYLLLNLHMAYRNFIVNQNFNKGDFSSNPLRVNQTLHSPLCFIL